MERRVTHKLTLGPFARCDMPLESYKRWSAPLDAVLERLRADANIDILNFDKALCADGICRAAIDGVPIYRDDGHFSYEGSRAAARTSHLLEEIQAHAR
jgi:hypothetical protein